MMRFSLTHPNGMTVRGALFPAPGGGRKPSVLVSHGFNGCCADLYGQAEAFARAGIHAFVFDFCGGGERTSSDGRLSEMMTPETEKADLKLVLSHVRSRPEADPSRIFLLGESQGGFISTLAAEELPEAVRGLILWFPALMIPDASRERLEKGIDRVFGVRLSPDFDPIAAAIDPWAKMPDYPGRVLLIHGDADPVVPLSVSRRALSLFPDAELLVLPGAGHGFGGTDLETALGRSAAFILDASRPD